MTAVAYDNPIPGFDTNNTINLRLWAAKPDTEFDLEAFNTGDYVQVHPTLHLTQGHVRTRHWGWDHETTAVDRELDTY